MNNNLQLNLFIISLFCFLSLGLQAQVFTVQSVPNPTKNGGGWISDPGGMLSGREQMQVNDILFDIEQATSAEMAVVILPSIGDNVPKDFAVELFEEWGIGKAENDNGLLLLIVQDQRRSEFETGYGMEYVMPDLVCYSILMDELVPRFQAGDFGGGILATVNRVSLLLKNPEVLTALKADLDPKRNWIYFFGFRIPPFLYYYALVTLFFCFGLIAWIVITLLNKEDLYDKYRHIGYTHSFAYMIFFPLPYIILYFFIGSLRKRLRNQPRYSKVDGNLMHKLSEEEEDDFLESGQITEEELRSVDYDVWVTDDASDYLILAYPRRFTKYGSCPKCNFRTYHHEDTRVIHHATYSSSGKMEKLYACKNCHYQHRKVITIPRKTRSSSGGSGGFGGGGSSFGGGSSGGGGAGASW